MDEQLVSALATIVFAAVLLVTALFHIERIHAHFGEPRVQIAAQR